MDRRLFSRDGGAEEAGERFQCFKFLLVQVRELKNQRDTTGTLNAELMKPDPKVAGVLENRVKVDPPAALKLISGQTSCCFLVWRHILRDGASCLVLLA